ncbi:acetylcholine receptor subunit alpha [Aethina tumida]|uniref:acetylcholine receptor subunit alpha n=1 Tax=Aethina tumida TaxID=116153 RepID=UPI0021494F70|nr:acetylcholine receptor subunit alpha [Aethina tumida]
MQALQVLLCVFLISVTEGKFYKTNITNNELETCKVYYSRSGSIYKDFFEIKNIPTSNNTLMFDFHFSVLTSSDAHLLLAPSASVTTSDPVYEIVIGAGGNTFCDIRRQQKAEVKESVRIKNLLSAVDVRTFWLHITLDGVIEVGEEGHELPFISWTDPDPLPLKVFSFSTWSGIEAKWYFDCKRDEDNIEHFKKLQRKMTHLERLRADLLRQYNPYVRPVVDHNDFTEVNMSLSTHSVILNQKKGIMEVKGECKMKWRDEKMVWNSSEYGGITNLHIFRREIWQPDLILYNSVGDNGNILEDTMLIARDDGVVEWNASMTLTSWCDAHDTTMWPRDFHKCNLVLGFEMEFDKTTMRFNENDSTVGGYMSASEWIVSEVEVLTNTGWTEGTLDPAYLNIALILKRASTSYTTIFFTPYIIVAISLLLTFWVSPFGPTKISLACLELLICTLMLMALSVTIPSHSKSVPYLVSLYSYSLVGALISIVISVIVINLSRNESNTSLPHIITKILTSPPMKMSLCLCVPTKKGKEEYDKLSENSFKKSEDNQQEMWILLGVTIDRIAFFVYLGLVIYSIVLIL